MHSANYGPETVKQKETGCFFFFFFLDGWMVKLWSNSSFEMWDCAAELLWMGKKAIKEGEKKLRRQNRMSQQPHY